MEVVRLPAWATTSTDHENSLFFALPWRDDIASIAGNNEAINF